MGSEQSCAIGSVSTRVVQHATCQGISGPIIESSVLCRSSRLSITSTVESQHLCPISFNVGGELPRAIPLRLSSSQGLVPRILSRLPPVIGTCQNRPLGGEPPKSKDQQALH